MYKSANIYLGKIVQMYILFKICKNILMKKSVKIYVSNNL